jgi:penicillin-binding protein 2
MAKKTHPYPVAPPRFDLVLPAKIRDKRAFGNMVARPKFFPRLCPEAQKMRLYLRAYRPGKGFSLQPKSHFNHITALSERRVILQIALVIVALVYAARLYYLQVSVAEYKEEAQDNILRRKQEDAQRGVIYDRNGKVLASNKAVFDIMIIKKKLVIDDTARFCAFFGLEREELRGHLAKANATIYQRINPYPLLKQLSVEEFARIQDRINEFEGVYVQPHTIRDYPHQSLASVLGYVKEVDGDVLKRDTTRYYKPGDLIGKSGLEAYYEKDLRGRRGSKYVMVNARLVEKGSYANGKFDTLPVSGKDLHSSVDLDLQAYAERLMQNKKGAVVAIEPSTGEILTMVSAPSYDPNLLTGKGKQVSQNYRELLLNPYKPMFNRTIMAPYPPGSTFKTVQALIGLEMGVLDTINTSFSCTQEIVACHGHASPLRIFGSIQHSCNPFYLKAFKKIINQEVYKDHIADTRKGLEEWNNYVWQFGLGKPLGVDLPYESSGNIPTVAYYDRRFRNNKWKLGNIYSISIGQGEVGVLPLQLANLAALLANRGYFYTPHIVRTVGDSTVAKFKEKHVIGIQPAYFDHIARAMAEVVRAGTARRAFTERFTICGKTGTAQNPHGKDHSVFIAFAPLENPKIAIAVYVENSGFGGTWAAPVASLVMEKYLMGNIERPELENYVLSGNLLEEK